jgi:hypothetical protein
MSTGLVICSVCRCEVHQDGARDPQGTATWRHCHDKTPRCPGASSIYPRSRDDIVGPWCGRDNLPAEKVKGH